MTPVFGIAVVGTVSGRTATLRRVLVATFAVTAAGGAVVAGLTGAPSATAAPDPCAASEIAKTVGSVATSTGSYLDAHPETNQALTTIAQQQPGPQSLVTLKAYFDANPQVAKDMQRLQQPLASLSGRCELPITVPQLMGLVQAAQSHAGAPPVSLPGSTSPAQQVTVPSAPDIALPVPASASTPGRGPLPGAAAVAEG